MLFYFIYFIFDTNNLIYIYNLNIYAQNDIDSFRKYIRFYLCEYNNKIIIISNVITYNKM